MKMLISRLIRSGRRQLHTIVSKDIVKPSSPTPSHLRTHKFSVLDRLSVDAFVPLVTFYPSSGHHQTSHDKVLVLKKSLAYTLTKYYPLAGRMDKIGPSYMDCNDEGVDFIEARNDSSLSDFLQNSAFEDYDQLIPHDLVWYNHNHKGNIYENSSIICPLAVQVNHFACGGVAVATSLSHKIGDASSCFNFVNHWAIATRLLSSGNGIDLDSHVNPHFFGYQTRDVDVLKTFPERPGGDCVTKGFLFPDSKIKDLKAKVVAMTTESGQPITNPTRAEVLTWLIHKCAMNAAKKTNSDIFKPSGVMHIVNMRSQFVEKLPETSIGNFYRPMEFPTNDESQLTPNAVIGEIQKQKKGIPGMQNYETLLEMIAGSYSHEVVLETLDRNYKSNVFSFLNRFPSYAIDFGWGRPTKVILAGTLKNCILTYETPNGDGILANVCLEKEDMKTFEKDPELLSFC